MDCGKTQFVSEKVAQRVMASIRHNPGRKGKDKIPKRTYRCPDCRMWHITSHADWLPEHKKGHIFNLSQNTQCQKKKKRDRTHVQQ